VELTAGLQEHKFTVNTVVRRALNTLTTQLINSTKTRSSSEDEIANVNFRRSYTYYKVQ